MNCRVPDCSNKVEIPSRGLCRKHYARARIRGTWDLEALAGPRRQRTGMPAAERRRRQGEYWARYWARPENAERKRAAARAAYDPVAEREKYLKVRDRAIEQSRGWRIANRERANAHFRAGKARRRGATPDALAVDYMQTLAGDPCSYCGGPMEHVDHIEPIARGGDGGWENLTAACAACNGSKHARPLLAFLREAI